MKFPEVLTPPPVIYHGFSTQKNFWEDNSTPMNMTSCGRRNVMKHREINNGEKYIILDISYKIYCLNKREVNYSESKDYTETPCKELTTSLALINRNLNNKQRSRFAISEITNQDFRKLLRKFNNSPYLCCKIKQFYNETTEAYFFLIKNITKPMKTKRHF